MKRYFSVSIFTILICFLVCTSNLNAQTYVLKTIPTTEVGDMAITTTIEDKKRGRHFKNRMIYVGNNEAYYTFIPYLGYRADSLSYKYPNVPSFTYIKDVELFVEKLENSTKIYTKKDFKSKFGYEATNEFKNYHGTKVQKYASKNNFYELYFWVAETTGDVKENEFINILNELGLLALPSNKKIVALSYLGLEFPIAFLSLEKRSRQNLNREVFEDNSAEENTSKIPEKVFEDVTDKNEIQHLLNKPHTFMYKRIRTFTNYLYKSQENEFSLYLSDKHSNTLSVSKDYFSAYFDDYIILGRIDGKGNLIYESSKKRIKKQKKKVLDFSDYKLIYLNKTAETIDFCVQPKNDFWSFHRYTVRIKNSDYKQQNVDVLLPDGITYKGVMEEEIGFFAKYGKRRREYSISLSNIMPLKKSKTYVIKE